MNSTLDNELWWVMVGFGFAAAILSLATSYIGLTRKELLTERQHFWAQMLIYIFLTVSILAFVLRGLMAPQ